MLAEKIIFNLLAFSLFIIIFSKIIRKNDTNYISLLILQSIGICIDFTEIKFSIKENLFLILVRYLLSIILPVLIIILEANNVNFSEIIYISLAKTQIIIGNNKLAKKILLNLINKYPNTYKGHKLLAEVYEKEGGMRRAIDEYVLAIDIKKNDYNSYFKIANLLKDLGKKDESIEMLQNLIKSKPDYYDASIQLGELLCQQERFKEALTVYQDALKYNPADYELYYSLGIVYTRLSDFQAAKEMYEKAAEINHRLYLAYYSLGIIALFEKDFDLATEYFQKSIYEDLEAKSYYQLAKIYILKNEKDMAINFLNKAIELDKELIKLAEKEPVFEPIKQYITVSVDMDELEKTKKFTKKENDALNFLEETFLTVECINKNTAKQKINEKVTEIFDREKLKRIQEQDENDIDFLSEKEKNKDNKN
ncbi:MAG: tetratricopeptide repeat protein [Candidatus Scatovivens sp.]